MGGKNTSEVEYAETTTRRTTWFYLTVVALTAGCGLVVEIVAGRMIAPYLGMSLYTWTAIIAVVLAGFSIGHWVGGRIADWPGDKARRMVAVCLLFAGVSAALSLVLIRVISGPVLALALPAVPTILVITGALFFLPSFFVGIPSPVLTKLAIEGNRHAMGRVLGAFYAAGATGSIAGTLAAGFIFISWLGTIRTMLLVTGIYVSLGLILLYLGSRRAAEPASVASRVLPIAVTLILGTVTFVAGHKVLAFVPACDAESDYYCIRMADLSRELGEPARVMVLDNLGHGINLAERPEVLVTPYMEAQNLLANIHTGEHSPSRAFFIGGGAYSLPRAWLATRPGATLTIAEIDPAVTRMARKLFWLPRDSRLKIHHVDARRVRSSSKSKFDVIIGDAFRDISVPQHLVTREFFALVRKRLADGGIYLMNVVDSDTRPRLALSVANTLRTSFATVEVWRSNQTGERATFVIAAMTKPTPASRLLSRVEPGLEWHRIDANRIRLLDARLDPILLTDDYAPVDRLIGVE